ncbi:hypothetical protein B0H17DRAFT_1127729 [Mycena rosella]|uniref:Uncharacterized protein n=1 Tax=Mycena rosella TaxID=1033263 RepID=A0AAD7DYM1_MYCRO|nr:hypothetical protein B0H17DRAFT_1127729 [Mycena rosella]
MSRTWSPVILSEKCTRVTEAFSAVWEILEVRRGWGMLYGTAVIQGRRGRHRVYPRNQTTRKDAGSEAAQSYALAGENARSLFAIALGSKVETQAQEEKITVDNSQKPSEALPGVAGVSEKPPVVRTSRGITWILQQGNEGTGRRFSSKRTRDMRRLATNADGDAISSGEIGPTQRGVFI